MYKTASRFMQRSYQQSTQSGILGHDGNSFLQEVMRKLSTRSVGADGGGSESAMALALRRAGIGNREA